MGDDPAAEFRTYVVPHRVRRSRDRGEAITE